MKKALIIEDDMFLVDAYEVKMAQTPWEIITAKTGEEGYIKAIEIKPDIILLDLLLPGMTGPETLRKLKQDERTQKIPVVVASNVDQRDAVEEAKKLGAVDYFIKSNVTISDLFKKCSKYL